MARKYGNLQDVIVLRNSAAAITATTFDTQKTDARIVNFRSGFALITVMALDIASGDETYQMDILGQDAAEAATVVGTLTLSAVLASVAGVYIVNIDQSGFKKLQSKATLGGTTPSLTWNCVVVPGREHETYGGGAVIAT